jgi:outer membrane protein assembly factor BamB
MGSLALLRVAGALAACAALAACGAAAPADVPTPTADSSAIPAPAAAEAQARLRDWPEFGLDPQRSGTSELGARITAANVGHLRRRTVRVPGTVDSSPVYLHGVTVRGAQHDVAVVTTSYGRTLAIDADSGRILWTFTPPGYAAWSGTAQITTTSPIADPDRSYVYAASPNGLIHKLSLADGREAPGAWPVRVTHDATHEKLAAALNIDGADVLAATGGYYGDAPPYQGHLVAIDRATGSVRAIFNTLCADRRGLQHPATCPASDSAILSRSGAVVEPGGSRVLIDTGNGPWNGTTDFGDSVLELGFPSLRLRQSFTPTDQARLNATDTDLGSSAPALLGGDRVVVAGKDGVLRVLALSRLDGRPPGSVGHPLGGELQRLATPGGGELFTAPAVWRRGGRTTVYVADGEGTAAYVLRSGRLLRAWQNGAAGTSPVLVGGLLYVYDPSAGGIAVYRPGSPRAIAHLAGTPGHWNSPIVVDGHVIEPEGNANEHALTGTLDILTAP